jgi:CHAD domain-containing protein
MLREGSGFAAAAPKQLIRGSGPGIRREHGALRPGEAGPVKADYRVVDAAMTAAGAFRAVCLACVRHLEANREGMLAGTDPEYLHQMRVALRRLRTAFAVFAEAVPQAAPLLAELRWLRRALGEARDWDVFTAQVLRPALAQHPHRRGLRAVKEACEEMRAGAAHSARHAVESGRYRKLVRELRALCYGAPQDAPLPAPPLRRHAAAAIATLHDLALDRGRKVMRLDAEKLHRLRKTVRKLRYAVLFLAPAFPEARMGALAGAVESLQETLGGLNDCAVAEALIERAHAPGRHKACRILAKRVGEAHAARRKQLKKEWKAFRAVEGFGIPARARST